MCCVLWFATLICFCRSRCLHKKNVHMWSVIEGYDCYVPFWCLSFDLRLHDSPLAIVLSIIWFTASLSFWKIRSLFWSCMDLRFLDFFYFIFFYFDVSLGCCIYTDYEFSHCTLLQTTYEHFFYADIVNDKNILEWRTTIHNTFNMY
jgi:hypothetical protein